ncbi:MAG: HigA family addiction module antidote protein [Austwickia sp.]|nr:HigA family addiction module antidote protein [Actinomycetota bacterium]MCB1254111.1 HigA family addiction module antidote protein [Austwickia sp.]
MTDQLAMAFPPGNFLLEELDARGWSQADFAEVLGRPTQLVSGIILGKKAVTTETATQIGAALGTGADLWLNLQSSYDLWLAGHNAEDQRALDDVRTRSRMRELAPVPELRRRHLLPDGPLADQARALCELLEIPDLTGEPTFAASARRHNADQSVTPTQKVWLACARRKARDRTVGAVDREALKQLSEGLTRQIRDAADFARLPAIFAAVGVRLVYVEPFAGSKISGVSFLLDDDPTQPVIALSGWGKRLDKVLFTLLHEAAHVVLGHARPGQFVIDEGEGDGRSDPQEKSANDLADKWCLPLPMNLPANIRRTWLAAEAERQGVHPIVIVGRLQHQGVIDWKSELVRGAPRVDEHLAAW